MTITYCDIQFEDDVAETLSRKKKLYHDREWSGKHECQVFHGGHCAC